MFLPANVPPSGYLFPIHGPAPPAARGLPCTRSGCALASVYRAPFGLWGLSSLRAAVVLAGCSRWTCCSHTLV